jgi:transposase
MTWTQEDYEHIQYLLPVQRGNVEIDTLTFLNALQYMVENGCRWRALPAHFGKWSTIDRRFRYWIKLGIFDAIEKRLQSQTIAIKGIKPLALDSTSIKVHTDGRRCVSCEGKKMGDATVGLVLCKIMRGIRGTPRKQRRSPFSILSHSTSNSLNVKQETSQFVQIRVRKPSQEFQWTADH